MIGPCEVLYKTLLQTTAYVGYSTCCHLDVMKIDTTDGQMEGRMEWQLKQSTTRVATGFKPPVLIRLQYLVDSNPGRLAGSFKTGKEARKQQTIFGVLNHIFDISVTGVSNRYWQSFSFRRIRKVTSKGSFQSVCRQPPKERNTTGYLVPVGTSTRYGGCDLKRHWIRGTTSTWQATSSEGQLCFGEVGLLTMSVAEAKRDFQSANADANSVLDASLSFSFSWPPVRRLQRLTWDFQVQCSNLLHLRKLVDEFASLPFESDTEGV